MGKTGTEEWADENINILAGCEHGCLYCYGKAMARWHGQPSAKTWTTPRVCTEMVSKGWRLHKGRRIMFPTTHDITPDFLEPCLTVLGKLLAAGNQVLIVSKPHLVCIKRICQDLAEFKDQFTFRFTIGADDDRLLAFWESHAPAFQERLACLKFAFNCGFKTSVSMEPMLDTPNAVKLFHQFKPCVTDTIWLGKMNRIRNNVGKDRTPEVEAAICRIEANQTDEKIWDIYEALKHEPKVRWKDSIREVIGLEPAEVAA